MTRALTIAALLLLTGCYSDGSMTQRDWHEMTLRGLDMMNGGYHQPATVRVQTSCYRQAGFLVCN